MCLGFDLNNKLLISMHKKNIKKSRQCKCVFIVIVDDKMYDNFSLARGF